MKKKNENEETAAKPALLMRCQVLANGLRAGGGVCGRGSVIRLPEEKAAWHEGRGEVRILGPV